MRVFFAAGEADYSYWTPRFEDVLVAFSSTMKPNALRNPLWFLDSGAYTAMQKGLDPSEALDAYIEFLTVGEGRDHRRYPAMDVIGGGFEATWRNDRKMREAGLQPIAVMHAGEPYQLITRYLEAGVRDLALGGSAGVSVSRHDVEVWTDAIFAVLRRWAVEHQEPLARVHAFGQTAFKRLVRYPFYSADSTNWLTAHRFGEILYFDAKRFRLAGMHPKMLNQSGSLMLDQHLPLAALDGVVVDDARAYRTAHNINVVLAVTDLITTIWADRGVSWDDEPQRRISADAERAHLTEKWPEAMRPLSYEREPAWR